ncbi:MAG: glycoside hydrolase family 3 N-terminal domain-containing protein [Flavipsychrobacter sp.]
MPKCLLFFTVLLLKTVSAYTQVPDSLTIKIGQMIMIGLDDRKAVMNNSTILNEVKKGIVGGVILFEKNIDRTNPKNRLVQLTGILRENATIPLFVAIDEEGGKVHRLKSKYGFPSMPSAAYLGKIDNADTTLFFNRRLASTLSSLGINVNFAPTVDLAINPNNRVIVKNGRSYGKSYDQVVKHAYPAIKAHQEGGVVAVLKHYPGHGSSTGDTHLGLVDVTKSWREEELLPYSLLLEKVNYDAVMVGHMVNKKWAEDLLPATLSKKTINKLRVEVGFNGVLFSDDMQMQAISNHYGLEASVVMAINAGIDVLVFGNNVPTTNNAHVTATQIHDIIKRAVLDNKISRQKIDDAYTRIMTLKNKRFKK